MERFGCCFVTRCKTLVVAKHMDYIYLRSTSNSNYTSAQAKAREVRSKVYATSARRLFSIASLTEDH